MKHITWIDACTQQKEIKFKITSWVMWQHCSVTLFIVAWGFTYYFNVQWVNTAQYATLLGNVTFYAFYAILLIYSMLMKNKSCCIAAFSFTSSVAFKMHQKIECSASNMIVCQTERLWAESGLIYNIQVRCQRHLLVNICKESSVVERQPLSVWCLIRYTQTVCHIWKSFNIIWAA